MTKPVAQLTLWADVLRLGSRVARDSVEWSSRARDESESRLATGSGILSVLTPAGQETGSAPHSFPSFLVFAFPRPRILMAVPGARPKIAVDEGWRVVIKGGKS